MTGIVGRTRDGEPLRVRARIVVGADGIRSTIAERVRAPFERVGTSVAAMTYGYWPGLAVDGYEWNFRPDAASGVVPTNDGQACVYASASPRRIGRGGLETLTRIVAESSPDLAVRLAAGDTAARATHLHRSAGLRPAILGSRLGAWSATQATSGIPSPRTG